MLVKESVIYSMCMCVYVWVHQGLFLIKVVVAIFMLFDPLIKSRKNININAKMGTLSTHVFGTWTATGIELFSILTCLSTTIFILISFFPPLEMISKIICETPLSLHAKCSFPVAVRVSKTRLYTIPNIDSKRSSRIKDLSRRVLFCGLFYIVLCAVPFQEALVSSFSYVLDCGPFCRRS